ncbi:iron uptake transporter deferrochelatase/peroxidase subunit [Yinghuangia sp. ASG 101]|uniref:iron uptake transporter deferrochelatase/peroxidase subunit n=1 Tax=Yinghuangia sp. ASG 101 TaxID=2896848 RepID=UPI001E54CF59|nr:iron uptake transporter deferrochelatase/peroxidase subunit [Yinghuangia sp. ASG 101]UGQ15207.1 iron uptake transporter deferrochelatase/peroxidase subunit [Yinghuangia sp. ASG 101]
MGGTETSSPEAVQPGSGVSRRRLLGVAGAAGAGGLVVGAAGGAAGFALARDDASGPGLGSLGATSVPFHGARQAGITTPMQARTVLAAFDVEPAADRAGVAALVRRWSDAAARMSRGERADADDQVALDAGPSSLTVTFAFGATLFDRIGLADRRPDALKPLPVFPGDELDPARGDGDLLVQVCADDALVAFHAVRTLHRLARGTARVRWRMSGFTRSPGATAKPMTHRNLMGQVDGTNNPRPSDADFDAKIFVGDAAGGNAAWARGGSYVVVRRIRMLLDTWDTLDVAAQEKVIGRRKEDGAPLTGGTEHTEPDYGARSAQGGLTIAENAHIRVSASEFNRGATMLRRGYSYDDGFRADGTPDAGLLFIAWQADPADAFVRVQQKLARGDALSAFVRHETSGLFLAPPGCPDGGYVGEGLLGT